MSQYKTLDQPVLFWYRDFTASEQIRAACGTPRKGIVEMDYRLKYLEITSKYMLMHGAFGYPDNAVICALVKGQYLLMPHGSLAQTVTAFAALPHDLRLRVPGDEGVEVGRLRQSIREAALNRPKIPALATWTEITSDGHYQLVTSEDELVGMWIEQYLEDSKIELNQSFGISLSSVLPSSGHNMHNFMVIGENRVSFTGIVKLYPDYSLHSIYSTWDCTQWVWSPSMGKLFHGNPCPPRFYSGLSSQ